MPRRSSTASEARPERGSIEDFAWPVVMAAANAADRLENANQFAAFALENGSQLRSVPTGSPDIFMTWHPGHGWELAGAADDARAALIDLYLPICSATAARPVVVGHLGQSLDGFIATHAGESQWVTGEEDVVHSHRLRALSDAVVVGAGTVAADDPLLTTRHVAGPSPLRVIVDPDRRLAGHHRVFTDESAKTVYVCAKGLVGADEHRLGRAEILGVGGGPDGLNVVELVLRLRARGCARVFVEGGGVTVSAFLEAKLLDRLHIAVAPLLIGDGRPAIRLPAPAALGDCPRPRYRVFRMGGDMLFDFELRVPAEESARRALGVTPPIARII